MVLLKEVIDPGRFGVAEPIIVNGEGFILDGHSRARACLELGIKPQVKVKKFENRLLEKKFVIEVNLRRRHLNDFQRAELAYVLEPIEKELAKQRQGTRTDLGQTSSPFGNKVPEKPHERKSSAITALVKTVCQHDKDESSR